MSEEKKVQITKGKKSITVDKKSAEFMIKNGWEKSADVRSKQPEADATPKQPLGSTQQK